MRYLMVDARYEKVLDHDAVHARVVQIAALIDPEGQRHVLAVELAKRKAKPAGRRF